MSHLRVIKPFVILTVVCALVAPTAAVAGGPQAPGGNCPEGFCGVGNAARKFCESDQVPKSIAHPLCFSSADSQDDDPSDDLPTIPTWPHR